MARKSIEDIRRKEIIDAFFAVVAEKGLLGASTREIANAADCQHGMLRHYFGSKEGIIQEAINHLTRLYLAEIDSGIPDEGSALDRISFLFDRFQADRIEPEIKSAWLELLTYSKTNAAAREAYQAFFKELTATVASIIRAGVKAGEFKKVNAKLVASVICGSLEGLILLVHLEASHASGEKMNQQLKAMVSCYLVGDD